MEERKYLTDDRDFDHEATLHADVGGNGDYYLYTTWKEGGKTKMSPWVRFCTSGGCSTVNHYLLMSVFGVYNAMGNEITPLERSENKVEKCMEVLYRILEGEIKTKEELDSEITMLRIM